MSYMKSVKTICALTIAATAVSGCVTVANQDKINTGTFRQLEEDRNMVLLEAPAYADAKPVRVTYNDKRLIEEYTLYRSEKGQAEILYAQVSRNHRGDTALNFQKLIAESLKMWRFNQGQTLKLGETFLMKNAVAEFWVQPYRQIESGRECAGFSSTWDTRPNDRQLRPAKALFGYHCVPKGTSFGPNEAQTFMQSMQIRGVTVPLRIETVYQMKKDDAPPPPKDVQRTYLVLAQDGGGGGIAGMPQFPLLIAAPFTDFDGPCSDC